MGRKKGFKHSEETKQKMRERRLLNPSVNQFKKGNKVRSGKKHTYNTKMKIKEKNSRQNHPQWKGGITDMKQAIRNNAKYMDWKNKVLKRDNYTCQICGNKNNLQVHHIFSIKELCNTFNIKSFDELYKLKEMFDIGNGITLCAKCHVGVERNLIKLEEKAW